mgnify:FL=1
MKNLILKATSKYRSRDVRYLHLFDLGSGNTADIWEWEKRLAKPLNKKEMDSYLSNMAMVFKESAWGWFFEVVEV